MGTTARLLLKSPVGKRRIALKENLLFHCDNLDAIDYLLENGFENKIDLVYIDPPFLSGEKYFHRVENTNNPAFDDVWKGDRVAAYLGMIRPRLAGMRRLLASSGSIFLHLDWHVIHYVKVAMDEIFGPANFRNEVIVKRGRRKNLLYQFKSMDRMHTANDSILWYSKSEDTKFSLPYSKVKLDSKWMGFWSNINRPTMRYKIFGYRPERGQWKWSKERALQAMANYRVYEKKYSYLSLEEYWTKSSRKLEFIRKRAGVKYPEYWIPPKTQKLLDNVWLDVEAYSYSTGYGTEKHKELLERIVGQFSKPGDLVADFFCGSGTTLAVAQNMQRRWIGCDSSPAAISVTKKRLGNSFNLIRLKRKL